MHIETRNIKIYKVEVADEEGNHSIYIEVNKDDKSVLILLSNPNYQSVWMKYNHLKDIAVNNKNTKPLLLVQFLLGVSEYAKLKTKIPTKMGQTGEPVDKKSKSGKDVGICNLYLAQSSTKDYHNLC